MKITINNLITLDASPSGWLIRGPLGSFSSNWGSAGIPAYVVIHTPEERVFAAKFALSEYAIRMRSLLPTLDRLLENPDQIEITQH